MIETIIRNEMIDDVGPWIWLKSDDGAWSGPKEDWINDHKPKIFKYLKKFDYVLQAGGNQGMYPKIYAKYFKQVLTLEPDFANFYVLCQNCPEENIIKLQAALGHHYQMAGINRMTDQNTGMHTILPHEKGNIPVLTIDSFVFPELDLIHLDIERMELEALQGGVETIKAHKPVIVVEGANTSVTNFLTQELGYEFKETTGYDGIFTIKE